jgi:plasmid stabilization system protein ParE
MTARYTVFLTHDARMDSTEIQNYLAQNYHPDKADAFEAALFNEFLLMLSKTPKHKVVSSPSRAFHTSLTAKYEVRCTTFRPTKKGAAYLVFYVVKDFPVPNPEPTTDYPAGEVYVATIRSAYMAPLTQEEIDKL